MHQTPVPLPLHTLDRVDWNRLLLLSLAQSLYTPGKIRLTGFPLIKSQSCFHLPAGELSQVPLIRLLGVPQLCN